MPESSPKAGTEDWVRLGQLCLLPRDSLPPHRGVQLLVQAMQAMQAHLLALVLQLDELYGRRCSHRGSLL